MMLGQRKFNKWQVIDEYSPENQKAPSKSMQKTLPDKSKNTSSIVGKETRARKFSRWSVIDKYTPEHGKPIPKDVEIPRDNSPVSGKGKEIVPLVPEEEKVINDEKKDTVSLEKVSPDNTKNSSILSKETRGRKFSRWSVIDKYTPEHGKPIPKDVEIPRDNSPVSDKGKEIVPLVSEEEKVINDEKKDTVSLEKISPDNPKNSSILSKETRGRKFSRWSVIDKYTPAHETPKPKDVEKLPLMAEEKEAQHEEKKDTVPLEKILPDNPKNSSNLSKETRGRKFNRWSVIDKYTPTHETPKPKDVEKLPLMAEEKEAEHEEKKDAVPLEKILPDNPKNSSNLSKETRGRKFNRWSVIDKYTPTHGKSTPKDVEKLPLMADEKEAKQEGKKDTVSQNYVERMKLKKFSDVKLKKLGHVDDCVDLRKRVIVKNTLKLLTEKPICFSELFR